MNRMYEFIKHLVNETLEAEVVDEVVFDTFNRMVDRGVKPRFAARICLDRFGVNVDYSTEEIKTGIYDDTYTVALMTDYGYGNESCHPLAVGVDHAIARSIKRHYDKTCHWSDYTQTGDYVTIVSRKWCTNHEDFEHEYTWDNDFDGEEAF